MTSITDCPRELKGSCHCGAVQFKVLSCSYIPYQLCYCSICAKTNGSGGFAINLGAEASSLTVTGEESVSKYKARLSPLGDPEPKFSEAERAFCKHCGSHLWLFDARWPELIHPLASAVDTELPVAPSRTHIFLKDKASWVQPHTDPQDMQFEGYPAESLEQWHKRTRMPTSLV